MEDDVVLGALVDEAVDEVDCWVEDAAEDVDAACAIE